MAEGLSLPNRRGESPRSSGRPHWDISPGSPQRSSAGLCRSSARAESFAPAPSSVADSAASWASTHPAPAPCCCAARPSKAPSPRQENWPRSLSESPQASYSSVYKHLGFLGLAVVLEQLDGGQRCGLLFSARYKSQPLNKSFCFRKIVGLFPAQKIYPVDSTELKWVCFEK